MWSTSLREYQRSLKKRLMVRFDTVLNYSIISGENPEHVRATKMLLENLYREALANGQYTPETITLSSRSRD